MLFYYLFACFALSFAINLDQDCEEEPVCCIDFVKEGFYTFQTVNNAVKRLDFDRFPNSVMDIINLPELDEITIRFSSGLPSEICKVIIGNGACILIYVEDEEPIHCCATTTQTLVQTTNAMETTTKDTQLLTSRDGMPNNPDEVSHDPNEVSHDPVEVSHYPANTPHASTYPANTPHASTDLPYPTPSFDHDIIIISTVPAGIMILVLVVFIIWRIRKRRNIRTRRLDVEEISLQRMSPSLIEGSSESLFNAETYKRD